MSDQSAESLEAAALANADAGDWRSAAAAFEAAARCSTARQSECYDMAAQAWAEADEHGKAASAARLAVAAAPGCADAHTTLGRALRNCGEFGEAAAALQRALALGAAHVVDEVDEALELEQLKHARGLLLPRTNAELRLLEEAACCCTHDGAHGPGTRVWECGVVLARYLAAAVPSPLCPPLFGRHILELGAGTGIAGIAAAALGASVTLTDIAGALPLLRRNADANARVIAQAGGAARVACLDWREPQAALADNACFDVVIAADCVYNAAQLPPFLSLLARLAAPHRTGGQPVTMLIAHKARDEEVLAALLDGLRGETRLHVHEVPFEDMDAEFRTRRVKLFACMPARAR